MKTPLFAKVGTLAVAAALTLAACSSGSDSTQDAGGKPTSGGDLVMARAADATSMLPLESTANADIWVLQQVYETLTVTDKDGKGVEPLLATKWAPAKDGLSWTFTIRDGVTFSNGAPLTSADVKWSLDFDRKASATNQWSPFFERITSIEAPDPKTVTIKLSAPWPALPSYLALFAAAIYPADFAGHDVAYMRQNPIGTGPFKLRKWTKGQSVVIEKNPKYWDKGLPHLDSVTFNVVPDDNTRSLQLQGGQAQIDEFPSPASIASLSKSADVTTKAFDSSQLLYLNVNAKKPYLGPKVRRALSYAVDRKAILKTVLSGYGKPANSYLADGLLGHDDSGDGAEFSIAKAKSTLAASGTPTGLTIKLQIMAGNSQYAQIAQILKASWDKIGVKTEIKSVDIPTLIGSRDSGEFDMYIGYATSDVVDPIEMTQFLVLADGSGTRTGYSNPDVTALAKKLDQATEESETVDLLKQIQQIATEEAPIIPIAYQPLLYAFNKDVKGFASPLLGTYTFRTAWLDR